MTVLSFVLVAQIYANDESDNVFITYSHLLAEERLLLVSDSVGHVTALDLRTNQQVRLCLAGDNSSIEAIKSSTGGTFGGMSVDSPFRSILTK